MDEVQGYINSVLFKNEVTSYIIARIKLDQKKDESIVVVGYFELPKKQELCRYYGSFIDHPRYGRQFKVDSMEKLMPTDEEAIIRYLSSSMFPKVGPKAAEKVIEALGLDCLKMIQQDNSVLNRVNIKEPLKEAIIKGLVYSTRLDEAIKLFVGHGIEMKYLIKMDSTYGDKLVETVLNNPYVMVRDIDGIGFKTCDRIAASLGIEQHDSRRIEALIVYSASQICYQTQDTYTTEYAIFEYCQRELSELDYETFSFCLNRLIENNEIVNENGNIYPASLYEAETGIAGYLYPYIVQKDVLVGDESIKKEIRKIEEDEGIEYSPEQVEAIIMCINNGLTIITGGPGTGKTTVVNAIIKIYRNLFPESVIKLCAPTGRAAKRMAEITKEEATTMHRLLKWDLDTNRFEIDEQNPIYGDFLIVDEFSMVDSHLFYHLLMGTHPFGKILLIGDDQQLPPVSPGDVLRDLLDVKNINRVKLIKIHRQSANSGIIPLCYDIRNGVLNRDNLVKDDVTFIPCKNIDVKELVLREVDSAVERGFTQQEIQVLAPMYDGVAGIRNLNDALREFFNPPTNTKKEVLLGRTTYREGDKILQLKNQPDDDIYNGDIGILTSIMSEKPIVLFIDFDGNMVKFSGAELQNITHAYCISVHKSQGSEYPYVIMPVLYDYRIMLKRKLIYTGISRTKKELVLLGSVDALERGVQLLEQNKRKTSLKQRLMSRLIDK